MAGATYTEVGAVLGITQQGVSARVRSYLAASTPAPATPRMSAVMVSGDGSSSPIGRLTGPADLVDKLEKLIDWAHRHNPLAPLGSATSDGADAAPARDWVGAAAASDYSGMFVAIPAIR